MRDPRTNSLTEGAARRGFSLLELLIVLSVTAVLLALLTPGFARIRESARQVICANNLRQVGIALAEYVDDKPRSRGRLPVTAFGYAPNPKPTEMMLVRFGSDYGAAWDGIGILYNLGYINSAETYYCPSNTGEHSLARYEEEWSSGATSGMLDPIYSNYHYRGYVRNVGPIFEKRFDSLRRIQSRDLPQGLSIVSDGLRTRSDYSHVVGNNTLYLDLSVSWYDDPEMRIYGLLPDVPDQNWQDSPWVSFDRRR
ncbi:MAG: type II secretion system protein [Phycisphaerales bacterium]